jgi:hypothetical protein
MMVNDPKVGDFVYRHCYPQKPGIIRAVLGKDFGEYFVCVRVQWLGGEPEGRIESTDSLKDFNALIADHRKKLTTHETSLMRLKSLQNKIRIV